MGRPSRQNCETSFWDDPVLAIEEMMELYGSLIIRTAYFYVNDRYLAEDISQEVFIRAYRNWGKFRGDSSVKTWLIKITINLCRDHLRKKIAAEPPLELKKE
jgi:RNA polymerase sigma-70 factor, ECF subfamily